MKLPFAIATFCYGDRYYEQTNRLINSFLFLDIKPEIFIVTDSPESIKKYDFVKVKNICEYNSKYVKYHKNYYNFDFSVKRFSLLYAFEEGYNNVILVDTDIIVNENLYSIESIMNTFTENTISGQVTYSFNEQIKSNSMLGKRFIVYEETFNVSYDKELLNQMVEDCIQFISIDDINKFKFIDTWNKCIEIKDNKNLLNIPAGNIDEMCFSALYNNINVINSSNKSINILIAKHEKWY
jgi:hypothetical protein